ncbi:unnamed protein product [Staurois parvus]|uniref:Uncharacterized protein n=1 Tax=Staurois parvus TaxID=386267 RepID=A0ABN9AX51_9NEOB|nr:unnamed protein product [Staurois parvus]
MNIQIQVHLWGSEVQSRANQYVTHRGHPSTREATLDPRYLSSSC